MTQAQRASALVSALQERIVAAATALEPSATFRVDDWSGTERQALHGGGSTRIINGDTFEKGGVNTSIVHGKRVPPALAAQRPELFDCGFFAAGVSVVLHPRNPKAPTAHCNYRYFEARIESEEMPRAWWFGGGADLTPYFPQLEDARRFHGALRGACDAHDPRFYPAFKAWCDRYFYLKHRNETRGVGGIFFDYLDESGFGESAQRDQHTQAHTFDELLAFVENAGQAFIDGYMPIVRDRERESFDDAEREFQLLRRGRYVEFNLIYDRGTHFGLQSGGRTESILMSLPPLVRWEYRGDAAPTAFESRLQPFLQPRDWFAENALET